MRFTGIGLLTLLLGLVLFVPGCGDKKSDTPSEDNPAAKPPEISAELQAKIDEQLKLTKHGTDSKETWMAGERLGELGGPAVEYLIWLLKHETVEYRFVAACALGEIKDPRAVAPLLAVMRGEKDDDVAGEMIDALQWNKDPAVGPGLLKVMQEDKRLRSAAANALSYRRDPQAVEPILALLKSGDIDPLAAADALGRLKDRRATPALLKLFEATEWETVRKIASALSMLGDPAAIPAFEAKIKAYKDKRVGYAVTDLSNKLDSLRRKAERGRN